MSGDDRITLEELRYISVFHSITGVTAYRCIVDEENNRLIFLVSEGEAGRAIGRGGRLIKLLREALGKNIEVVEYSSDLERIVKNLFPGVKIESINVRERNGVKQVVIKVSEDDKGAAIGKGGKNVKRARLVLNKLFGVEKVVIR
ncbi:chain A, crystal structure Of archaeal transcription termination factor Nusa [Aeropyrum pernix]|uniref:Probable transcription termination protein NusA n=1 Tax=Aeropyrum pernix TaxID=56636 RepID=A0A401H8U9_AERPX|nr:NusA-like transcription termination signal-binding factor [Aeropyrum pernix]GBF08896.1 chain A, crystal structure Of archaeal transcription termination factor Nusa [Aeropyrum pernix]